MTVIGGTGLAGPGAGRRARITRALTTIKQGLVPTILSEAGAPAPTLRAAILDRYRRAS